MNLEIDVKTKNGEKVLKLTGELDAYTAPALKEKLMPLVEKEEQKVRIDLSEVTYMDSTGLGVFIGALKASQRQQGRMQLYNPQERIERLFSITGLSEVMDIRQGEEVQ